MLDPAAIAALCVSLVLSSLLVGWHLKKLGYIGGSAASGKDNSLLADYDRDPGADARANLNITQATNSTSASMQTIQGVGTSLPPQGEGVGSGGLGNRSSTLSTNRAPASPRSAIRKLTPEPWAKGPVQALGLDLGSYQVKVRGFIDNRIRDVGAVRSCATATTDGINIGEVDVAIDFLYASFLSLPKDIAERGNIFVKAGALRVYPQQALGGLIKFMLNNAKTAPSSTNVGVSVAPYFSPAVPRQMYAAGITAGLSRLYVFDECAAYIASLLRYRASPDGNRGGAQPSRYVVFADCGKSGVSAYVCEMGDMYGQLLHTVHRTDGIRNLDEDLAMKVCQGRFPADDLRMLAKVVEAVTSMREELSKTPQYLSTASPNLDAQRTVEGEVYALDRTKYLEGLSPVLRDVEAIVEDVQRYVTDHFPNESAMELHLCGGLFQTRELKRCWEKMFTARQMFQDKVNASYGAAVLAAMQHPRYKGPKYDISPLFAIQTVAESGARVQPVNGRVGSSLYTRMTGSFGIGGGATSSLPNRRQSTD